MAEIKIGKMLLDVRNQMHVSRERLCNGLCTVSSLFKYETGEHTPDIMLFYELMSRLGKAPERFVVMISKKEHNYICWKNKTINAIRKMDWNHLKELRLQQLSGCNEKLHQRYLHYLDFLLYKNHDKNKKKAIEAIITAIQVTVPQFNSISCTFETISCAEIELILIYLVEISAIEKDNFLTGHNYLKCIRKYIENNVLDVSEKVKIYPRVICTEIKLYGHLMEASERIHLVEDAFSLLKDFYSLYDMVEVLELLCNETKNINSNKYHILSKQTEELKKLLNEYNNKLYSYTDWIPNFDIRCCTINEALYYGRIQKEMTQEELSDGICAVESYSRIENGKRSPSRKKLTALIEKLELGWGYYQGEIFTEDFADFELLTQIKLASANRDDKKLKLCLTELEKKLNMDVAQNVQFIKMMKNILLQHQHKINKEKYIIENKKILSYTITDVSNTKRFFTRTEIDIMNQIARMTRETGNQSDGIRLMENVIKNRRQMEDEDLIVWHDIALPVRICAGLCADINDWKKCFRYAKYLVSMEIRNNSSQYISTGLNLMGWALEHIGNKSQTACDRIYQQTVYMSDLLDSPKICGIYREYYEKHFISNFEWYEL